MNKPFMIGSRVFDCKAFLVCFVCFQIFGLVHAQEVAQVTCSAKMQGTTNRVPVFTSPGSSFVIEYLSCGQKVTMLGNEEGFDKVQFGDHVGYVVQQSIAIQANNSVSESSSQKSKTGFKSPKTENGQLKDSSKEPSGIGKDEISMVKPVPSRPADLSKINHSVDLDAAIAYGSQFKSRKQFLEKGLKNNKVQLASAWAVDGISKYVTFFTDFEAVASAAANAQQEMRSFTSADALKLPLSGLVYANVEVHGRGMLPTRKVASRYVKNSAHLVIQFDEEIIQPLSKEILSVRDASFVAPVALFSWWDVGNVSLLTGGALGWDGAKAELEFVFTLTPEQMKRKGTVILIDADGNRHKEEADFSRIIKTP